MFKMRPIVYEWKPRFDPHHMVENGVKIYISSQWFEISGFEWKNGYALLFELWQERSMPESSVSNHKILDWVYYDERFPAENAIFFGPLSTGRLTGHFAEQMLWSCFIRPVFFPQIGQISLLGDNENIVQKYFPIEYKSRQHSGVKING